MFKWLKINNFTFITENNCFVKFSENTVQRIAECKCPASVSFVKQQMTTDLGQWGWHWILPATVQLWESQWHLSVWSDCSILKGDPQCPSFSINPLTAILLTCPSLGLTAVSCPIFHTKSLVLSALNLRSQSCRRRAP